MSSLATVTGLWVVFGGPLLIAGFGDRLFGNPEHLSSKILQQSVLATLLVIVFGIVFVWERQPLSSVGLHGLCWQSMLWDILFILLIDNRADGNWNLSA